MRSIIIISMISFFSSVYAADFWEEHSYKVSVGGDYDVVVSKFLFTDRGFAQQFCQRLKPKMKLGTIKDSLYVNIYGNPKVPQTQWVADYSDGTSDTGFWAWETMAVPYKLKSKNDKDARLIVQFRGSGNGNWFETSLEEFTSYLKNTKKAEKITYIDGTDFKGVPAICVYE
ncbi:MAG: hypothetical protein REI12_03225 [Pedobacter sp.]|nr:hypothetical protein [Pedobacter sp.]